MVTWQKGSTYGLDPDPPEDWRQQAACRDEHVELMFPHDQHTAGVALAKAVCRRCPVTEECLNAADELRAAFGIWGGLTPAERRNRAGERVCEECGATYLPVLPSNKRCSVCRAGGLRPCGTDAAWQRHRKNGEEPCQLCRRAHAVAKRGQR